MAFQIQQGYNGFNIDTMPAWQRLAIANGTMKTDPATYAALGRWINMTQQGFKLAEKPSDLPAGAQTWAQQVGNTNVPRTGRDGTAIGLGISNARTETWFKDGQASQAAATAAPTPAAAAPAAVAPPVPQSQALVPGLSFDVRSTGEDIGIKRANSTSRKNKTINKGTNKLTIPRSSGASSLTIA